MDAMPVTLEQEFSGYARQLELGMQRIEAALHRMREMPMGGTAVGTGINTSPEFPLRFAEEISKIGGESFLEAQNHFEAQATVDAPVEVSGQLKTIAVGLMKIVNDLRWMNSGPNAGLGEIQLAALQPGSSIMPGKVNPVIEESTGMVCAQVMGNDVAVNIGGASGNFELNVYLPMMADNLLSSTMLLTGAVSAFNKNCAAGIEANAEQCRSSVERNLAICTSLAPVIGYDRAAGLSKLAFKTNQSIREVALADGELSSEEIDRLLDFRAMTEPTVD